MSDQPTGEIAAVAFNITELSRDDAVTELMAEVAVLRAEVARLTAERDRYRAELERMAAQHTILIGNPYASSLRAALASTTGEPREESK